MQGFEPTSIIPTDWVTMRFFYKTRGNGHEARASDCV